MINNRRNAYSLSVGRVWFLVTVPGRQLEILASGSLVLTGRRRIVARVLRPAVVPVAAAGGRLALPVTAALRLARRTGVPDQARNTLESHLADGRRLNGRGLVAAEGEGILVGIFNHLGKADLHLGAHGVGEAEEGNVGLGLDLVGNLGKGLADDAGRVDGGSLGVLELGLDHGELAVALNEPKVLGGDNHDGAAALSSATSSSNTVNVLLAVERNANLDDKVDVGEVQATSNNVRGKEDTALGALELLGRPGALRLVHARLHLPNRQLGGGSAAGVTEEGVQESGLSGGGAEDNGLELGVVKAFGRQKVVEGRKDIVNRIHLHVRLRDAVDGRGLVLVDSGDVGVLGSKNVMQHLVDCGRERGTEAHTLPASLLLLGQAGEDLGQGRQEALVEHAVGLVQDQAAEVVELLPDTLLGKIVIQATGSSDEDGGLSTEELVETGDLGAATNGKMALEPGVALADQLLALVHDLLGKLTGGSQDQQGYLRRVEVLGVQECVQGGEKEGNGLAGSRLGLDEAVLSEGAHVEHLFLDGSHVGITHAVEGLEQAGIEAASHIGVNTRHVGDGGGRGLGSGSSLLVRRARGRERG